MKKRWISLLLAAALLCGLCVTASADTQSVLALVKQRIGDTAGYEKFESGAWEENGRSVYHFSWSSGEDEDYVNLNVTATDSGIITEYSEYRSGDWEDTGLTLNRPTPESVLPAAREFLQKLNPTIAGELTVEQEGSASLRDSRYSFRIRRVKDGIPVNGDTGYIQMAADGQRVMTCYLNYTEGLTFASAAGDIGKTAAQKAFAEKLGMRLSYQTKYEKNAVTAYLAYAPAKTSGTYISALTGEPVTPHTPGWGRNDRYAAKTEEAMADNAAGAPAPQFSPAEQGELDNLAGLLSQEAEEKLLRENKLLHLDSTMQITRRNRGKAYVGGQYIDNISFEGESAGAYVSLDAKTGRLLSYSFYDYKSADTDTMTKEQATAAAEEAAKTLAGDLWQNYRKDEDNTYGVRYVRYVNDIPFDGDAVRAYVSEKTGLLTEYSIGYTELDFPSPVGVLTPAQAAEKLFAQVDYVLTYMPDCSAEDAKRYDRAIPVYALEREYSLAMDPFTGELLQKEQENAALPEYTDIAGHYAEKAILALRDYGIGFETAEYEPRRTITQGEYATLLNAVFRNGGPVILGAKTDYAAACRNAIRSGILKESELDAEAPLTREMAAILLIRALGLEDVAELKNIYKCPFPDVTANVGYVSILGGMGVFHGDSKGNFNPASKLTRADAAIILYNYLTR